MARVDLEHVEKTYPDGTRALRDLDLSVADGELVVVVGPSGCGKSTLLRLVAGLEEPTGGRLRIGDRVVNALRPQERNVAMVFQDYALYPYLTARRNLEFPLRMRGMARAERTARVARVAALLDIGTLLERLPRHLSGGQRQRVAMGRALVREPAVFLLDEPLSNLDAKLRVQVRAEIKDLQRRTGTTMLYVTHDQVEAMTLGDRVVVLHAGRLQQAAPPDALYARPANAFVAGFIGNPPMNLLPARVAGGRLVVAGVALAEAPPGTEAARTVGVRPEALRVTEGAAPDALRGVLEHVEYLGHETLLHVRLDGDEPPSRVVARVDGMAHLAPGAAVAVGIDAAQLHLFDAEGRAIRD